MDFLWTHGFSWFVHICFVFEVQNVQLCQISIISIQLPIATNLRTRLRRSLQSLAHDIMESLGADHVAIFGDKAALDLDVLSFFWEEDENIRRYRKCHCNHESSKFNPQLFKLILQSCCWERRHPIFPPILVTCDYYNDLWAAAFERELCGGKYPHPDVAEVQYTRPVQVGVWHFG